ncbi:histidinol-phosphate transaminase [Idiomarina seosinensis]|uniref:Histidinol-phosphate aminotransferase n=1 Tax=Idiomarina seosinensis TaxID=281739 RepID=A0A432ZI95_9GAMM|nr:histidinol-phosphate transaminase [Idiomarina seosinensis]RUO77633.1 histidinol-phosphate transaminase [Idiomarina seosinensis]
MAAFDATAAANSGVKKLQPYQAGKPMDELQRELGLSHVVKLASNENPLGLSEKVRTALQAELSNLIRYPDANGFYLKSKLAELHRVEPQQITLGNGSNDVLEILARTFVSAEEEVIFSQHAFVVYPLVTQAIGAKGVAVPAKDYGHDLEAMAAAVTDKTKMIFVANPNNPTGTFLTTEQIKDFLDKVPPHVIVVLDEAYYEYVPEPERAPSIDWLQHYPNLVVSRTFSKAYGLAGLRAGYAVSSTEIADLMNRIRQPFNVNALSLKAAEVVLDDHDYLQQAVQVNQQGMKQLVEFCQQQGYDYIPSYGNFLTIEFGPKAMDIYEKLLHEGIIVRPVGGYQLPNHLRVSIGLKEENQAFIDAMLKIG